MNSNYIKLKTQIKMGYWPGFIVGMYPSQFAYQPLNVDFHKAWKDVEEVNLYFHIPFCRWSCSFCTFFKVVEKKEDVFNRYVDKVIEQIQFYNRVFDRPIRVKSICFGGGTPNAIPAYSYIRIFDALKKTNFFYDKDLEPSIEVSPEDITLDYLKVLKTAGIQRVSMGVQSLRQDLRRDIGRGRNLEVSDILNDCRDLGLNINIDVINGIKHQDPDAFMDTLRELVEFGPETISTYILSGTDNGLIKNDPGFMSTKEKYAVFEEYYDYLTKNGYECESHVKFIKCGQNSTHQQKIYEYQGTPTLGIGCGARSYAPNIHYGNPWHQDKHKANKLIDDYISKPFEDLDWEGFVMNNDENKRRHVIYAWFMGVLDNDIYQQTFGSDFKEDFESEYQALINLDLVQCEGCLIKLNKKGRKYTDLIGVMFWSDKIEHMFNEDRTPCKNAENIQIVSID
ncbi:TPA: radical SAM protein [Vibrio parahaemolyticus]|nr:radical SAM protein [Vibrio parahaemolyticus]